MNEVDLNDALEFAKRLAGEAGDIMRRYYRSPDLKAWLKDGKSPVTNADIEINELLITRVKEAYPDHGVLGEEASYEPKRDAVWVCDPIDGTVSFLIHMPIFTFALSLVIHGEPLVSVVLNPMTQELFSAVKGGGAFVGTQPISVSDRKWNDDARLVRQASPSQRNVLDKSTTATKLRDDGLHLITSQGAIWSGILVADGSADGFVYEGSSAHDIATLKLLVEEAGGRVTDLSGNEQEYDKPIHGAIISNGHVHENLRVLAEASYAHSRD